MYMLKDTSNSVNKSHLDSIKPIKTIKSYKMHLKMNLLYNQCQFSYASKKTKLKLRFLTYRFDIRHILYKAQLGLHTLQPLFQSWDGTKLNIMNSG